jgi:hypothetical protein
MDRRVKLPCDWRKQLRGRIFANNESRKAEYKYKGGSAEVRHTGLFVLPCTQRDSVNLHRDEVK